MNKASRFNRRPTRRQVILRNLTDLDHRQSTLMFQWTMNPDRRSAIDESIKQIESIRGDLVRELNAIRFGGRAPVRSI